MMGGPSTLCGGVDSRKVVIAMSRRQLKTDDEEGFLRAFRDEVLDLVADYGVRVEFTLRLPVYGVGLVIHGEAHKTDLAGDEQVYAAADQPYPTHSVARLHAALYRAAVKLGGAIRERGRLNGGEVSPTVD